MSEPQTTIFKVEKIDRDFALIHNSVIRDHRLSYRATGLLCYLLSLPSDWSINSDRLASAKKEGRDAVRAALGELKELGYAELKTMRDGKGRVTNCWIIKEAPEPFTDVRIQPEPENPAPVSPAPESQAHIKERRQRKKPSAKALKAPSLGGLEFADWFRTQLPKDIRLVSDWREQWAREFDALVSLDKRDSEEIYKICESTRKHHFWSSNFMSPLKLRKKNSAGTFFYDVFKHALHEQKNKPGNSNRNAGTYNEVVSYKGVRTKPKEIEGGF